MAENGTARNGTSHEPAPDLRTIREQRKLVRAKIRLLQEQRARQLTEDIGIDSWPDYADFGGSDLFFRARTDGLWLPVPPSVPSDRRHGEQWPILRTEPELDRMRQQSRLLVGVNAFAQGLLRNLANYVIGEGYSYKIVPRGLKKDQKPDDALKKVIDVAQQVIDRFCERNRWNAVISPDNALIAAITRERETYCRVKRDGEAFLRFYPADDGSMQVRPIEPEQIRNGKNFFTSSGASFGIRHQMDPFEDVETPIEYRVVWQDPATAMLDAGAQGIEEFVEAKYVLHLKGHDTDAGLARGLPFFAFDVARALERAAKLQRNISTGAAIRAAIAEIIQFKGFTQQQVSAFVGGETDHQGTDPETGRNVDLIKERAGQKRRIPAGMEFVNPPADNSTPNYLQGVAGDIRQAAAAACVPEFFLGDTQGGNYSNLESAAAPAVKSGKSEQEYYRAAFAAVLWRALRWAAECGVGSLPKDVHRLVDIQVEAPAVLHRNELEKSQRDQIQVQGGWKSPQTCAMEDGLDPETEFANIKEFQEQQQAQQQGGMPGMGGEGGGMDLGGGGLPPVGDGPLGEALIERLLWERGFTGVDAHGHRWVNGKQVKRTDLNQLPAGHGGPADFSKAPATRGRMMQAVRVGTGKEAKVVLRNGKDAPEHIKPAMVAPDWTNVEVSLDPKAELLVKAVDNKGRPKSVYSAEHDMRTAAVKFARVDEMIRQGPKIDAEIQEARQNPKTREQADCAWLMSAQATRPGSKSDTGAKVKAYGATTLEGRHVVEDANGQVKLHFIGKEGVEHNHIIRDPKLAKMLLERKAKAGDTGTLFKTSESAVNTFIGKLDGGHFSAKDFRTRRANLIAVRAMAKFEGMPANEKEYKKRVAAVAYQVSTVLGNKPAQCLESYISPAIFSVWRATT